MPIDQLKKIEPKPAPVDPGAPPIVEEYIEERDPASGQVTRRRLTEAAKHSTEEISETGSTSTNETLHVTKITKPSPTNAAQYRQKRSIFYGHMGVRSLLVFIEILLAFRFFLKVFGADPNVWFAKFIYGLSFIFVGGFTNLFGRPAASAGHTGYVEWSTVMAAIFFAIIGWGLIQVWRMKKPITPSDLDRAVEGQNSQDPRVPR